jgi:NAD(P)-dependent dehydrogenase (short-subunit alcohol dehydrogenase family)
MPRIAVVTGGAQGLGAAIAKRFLEDGFTGVVLVDRNQSLLEERSAQLGALGEVAVFAHDLRDADTPRRTIELAMETFGRVDVLVNAAGNTERWGVADATPEAYDRMFDVNVKAPLFLMQAATEVMVKQKQGVIINVASMLAHGGPPNLAVYSASKAALVTLTKSTANTFKRDGVRAFAINLGWAATDAEHKLQTGFHNMPQNWAEIMGKRMPFGRLISPEDVAGLCAFLVSPPAMMMTGAVIDYEQMPIGVFDELPPLARE